MLIAEDLELNAEVLTDLLDMVGISSEWAENGQIAVDMISNSEENHFAPFPVPLSQISLQSYRRSVEVM